MIILIDHEPKGCPVLEGPYIIGGSTVAQYKKSKNSYYSYSIILYYVHSKNGSMYFILKVCSL